MSRLVIPVTSKTIWATGDIRLWVELDLLVRNNAGAWKKETFRVDTGTDLTTFPAHLGLRRNLPMPARAASGATHAQTGMEIRSGVLRFRIDGMDLTEYATPCLFLGDPNTMPSGNPGLWPRKLLQPLALLDQLRVAFDKNATVSAPYGEMTIEKK
jgi:hypothetical protein